MKKMMKCLAVCMLILPFLVGCGGGSDASSPYLGEWKATTAEMSGISMSIDTILGGDWIINLQANGKVEMTLGDETNTGSWKETDKGFIIEDEYDVVVSGDTGTLDEDGLIVTFEHTKK